MSNQSELAQLASVFAGSALSNRNLLINSAMQVAQRGTSASPASLFAYNTADRARLSGNSFAGTVDQSIVTGQNVGDFVGNALKTTITSAGASGSLAGYNYRIEPQDINMFDGKTMTFSFYAKADAATSLTFSVSGDSVMVSSVVIPLTTSWQRFTQTFTYSSTTSASFVDLTLRADGTILTSHYLTGVQLEVGDTATPFEHRSYGDELSRCQRYYWRGEVASGGCFGGGGTIPIIGFVYPKTMRATPSGSYVSGGTASNGAADFTITGAYTTFMVRQSNISTRLLFNQTGSASGTDGCDVSGAICAFDAEL
jgi:hypothetical protein